MELLSAGPDAVVTVVVHPVDTAVHAYSGWRWAIQVGDGPPTDLKRCVGAGLCETESEASVVGEQAGCAVAKALRLFGLNARYQYLRMAWDPIPAEADHEPLATWDQKDGGT